MTVTPRRTTKNIWTDNATALDYEIAQEKASTLGRLGRALEAALAALREFDAQPHDPAEAKQTRGALVAEASRALWHFVVQREALGLRDSRQVMRDYGVPGEVQSRMGALPARANQASHPPRG
jgi:hypothetical protein